MSILDTVFSWLPKLRKPDNSLADAQATSSGALKVAIAEDSSFASTFVDPAAGTPLTYRRVASSVAAKMRWIFGVNEGATTRWIMLFDANSFPANGAEPMIAFPVPAGQPFSLELTRGRSLTTGLTWVVSSTANNLTADAAATFRVNVEVST